MAVDNAVVSVAQTAVVLIAATEEIDVVVLNSGSGTVFIGPSDVDDTGDNKGWPLAAGAGVSLSLRDETLYGIAASGTHQVDVLINRAAK